MLFLKDITKYFGKNKVLDEINCTFEEQKVSVIVGKSGEGKSTLFRIIQGIEKETSGTTNIKKEDCGMVFQDYQLYPHLSVLNNLVLPQRVVLKREKKEAIEYSNKILIDLKISHLSKASVSNISGGESQRVAIARTLVMDKKIILFDEPTSALDTENIDILIRIIGDLSKTKTILIITHDMSFAKRVGDTIFKMENKKLKLNV